MKSYLKEMSAGEVIDGSVRLYFGNFLTIFLIYLLPLFAVELVILFIWPDADPSEGDDKFIVAGLRFVAAIPASAAITVAVSEIALGQKPRVLRAYGRVLAVIGRFLWTYLLVMIVFVFGLALFVVPGVIALVLLMFATVVVMLERRGGFDAMKRSMQLGKGYYLRNFGVFLLALVLILIVQMLLVLAADAAIYAFDDVEQPGVVGRMLIAAISHVFTPVILIVTALLYYDMRVRKENYDTAALAQDLVG